MIIVVCIIAVFILLVVIGNIKGAPNPSTMSIEAILGRMQSEQAWIYKYNSLPWENQQGEGLKKQYQGKKLYLMQLNLELMLRSSDPEQKTLIPTLQRSIELIKGGMDEKDAHAQAVDEYVRQRDADALKASEEVV